MAGRLGLFLLTILLTLLPGACTSSGPASTGGTPPLVSPTNRPSPAISLTPITAPSPAVTPAPVSPSPSSPPRGPAATFNVILVGWDGAQRNHVKEMMAKDELPNLRRLSAEGAIVSIDIMRTTDTKAGWTQILTGYQPEITGVFSNARYQPIPKGYTVFERLEAFCGKDNIVTVGVVGKKAHVDSDPPARERLKEGETAAANDTIVVENGVRYRLVPGKPYMNCVESMDVWTNGLLLDDAVGAKTLDLLETYRDKRFFFFIHFAEIDTRGHLFGENSPQSDSAYKSADTWTGRIVDKLKELSLYEKTLVYVTADHGFDEGLKTHNDAPYVFLATNDRQVVRPGLREDIAPTILERFGLDLSKLTPALDGRPLTREYATKSW